MPVHNALVSRMVVLLDGIVTEPCRFYSGQGVRIEEPTDRLTLATAREDTRRRQRHTPMESRRWPSFDGREETFDIRGLETRRRSSVLREDGRRERGLATL